MNKQILLTLLIVFAVVLSASAVSASEVNVTDSYATNLVDDTQDVSVPMENTADISLSSVSSDSNVDNDPSKVSLSSEEVLESEDSNTLSTNTEGNDSLSSNNGIATVSASQQDVVGADSNVSSTIDISKTVQAKSITKYYKGTTPYIATFLDASGKVLANAKVKITVNGKSYTKTTNAKGVASLGINLKPGTYKVISENPVTGYKLTTTFKILTTITASDVSKVYTDGRKFSAKFYKSNGKVLAKKTIKFKLKGKTYKVKTNKDGIAQLTTSHLAVGTYNVTSVNPVTGESTVNKLEIVKRIIKNKDMTLDFLSGKYYVVQVIGDDGKPVGAGEIVDIYANTIHYVAKTDKNGYARLKINLNPKTYYFHAEYKTFKTNKNKIVVKQTLKLVKKTVKVKKGKKIVLKAKLKWSSGKAIKGKKIVFKFKGKKYSAKTNKKGIAKVTIKKKSVLKKLKKGKSYKFTAAYKTNKVKGKVKVKK